MLKDLLLSITTPFAHIRHPTKHVDEVKNYPTTLESDEDRDQAGARRRTYSLNHHPARKGTVHTKSKRHKSNSISGPIDSERMIRDLRKVSVEYAKSYPINILVVGAKSVGKSALTVRFITRRYIGEYMSGQNQKYSYLSSDEKHQQPIIFLDESNESEGGKECLESQLSEENLTWADGIMLVYDVGDVSTFNYAKEVITFMTNKLKAATEEKSIIYKDKNANDMWKTKLTNEFKPILLVGNKIDLVKRRSVSDDDIEKAAEEFPPCVTCQQLSAAEDYDEVVKCINELITKIRLKRRVLYGLSARQNIKHFVGNAFGHRYSKRKPRNSSV